MTFLFYFSFSYIRQAGPSRSKYFSGQCLACKIQNHCTNLVLFRITYFLLYIASDGQPNTRLPLDCLTLLQLFSNFSAYFHIVLRSFHSIVSCGNYNIGQRT